MQKLVGQVGNWVEGDQFWNRTEEVRRFIELLEEEAHILLVAQRRVGKTSLMHEVSRRLQDREDPDRKAPYTCLHLDLENCQSVGDAIVQLSIATKPHLDLWSKTKEIFKNILSQARANVDSLAVDDLTIKLREGVAGEWKTKGDRLIYALGESEQPVILFIDELPILVNRLLKGLGSTITPEGRQQTEEFMSWLRSITIRRMGTIRLVVTGSIGLEPILRQANLSATINTLTPFELNPWSRETAMGCLRALANNKDIYLGPGVCENVVELLGSCIPHHVQLFFSKLYEDSRRREDVHCSVQDVERVYKTQMLSARGHVELSHMEERLKQVIAREQLPLVFELLTETAVTGTLTPATAMLLARDSGLGEADAKSVLKNCLYIFEHDGYLEKRGDDYTFVSRLLCDWWKARHGSFHTPAVDRRVGEETP